MCTSKSKEKTQKNRSSSLYLIGYISKKKLTEKLKYEFLSSKKWYIRIAIYMNDIYVSEYEKD